MSDTTYEVFQHYGTAAQRVAFIPAPASGIQPLYIWYETDTGRFWAYHTSWVNLSGAFTLLTADPATLANDMWWVVRTGASPTMTVALKARIAGATVTIASITM